MKNLLLKQTFCLLLVVCTVSVQAQITSTDNFTIYPASQGFFSPGGKFVALGESGGVVGPTANGCDAYGFRAQTPPLFAIIGVPPVPVSVNLGIETTRISSGSFFFLSKAPVLSASVEGLFIKEQNSSSASGCGTLLASFNEVTSSNNVFTVLGSATATGGSWNPSDRILKRDIETIKNPMDIINGLTGYTYEYRTEERPELRLPEGLQYGFVTQEVEKVMPTAVRQADGIGEEQFDFQVMEYRAIIPVLTEAAKQQHGTIIELEQKNTELEQKNTELEARLARLEALLLKDGASTTPNRMDEGSRVQLGQNSPNPTGANTTIDYSLPKDMTNAFLVVVDLNGREMLNQAIVDANGVLELNTSRWTAGTYVYSIIVDGKTLASKKMLVQ